MSKAERIDPRYTTPRRKRFLKKLVRKARRRAEKLNLENAGKKLAAFIQGYDT